ncbi:MAG: stage II sporulation protein D [Ruthenibacterium sp.]
MKQNLLLLLLFAVLVFVLPFAGLLVPQTDGGRQPFAPSVPNAQNQPVPAQKEAPLLILNTGTNTVDTVPARDFVLGAVAAEMPMSYSDEALKAQAVASHSYALALKTRTNGGDPNLQGAYFTANPAQRLGYLTDDMMRSFWGDSYAENRARLEKIVDSVEDTIIKYDGLPALACYHAISNGTTEASEAVWGAALPYLVSVDSPYDIASADYAATVTFSLSEISDALRTQLAIEPEGEPQNWFGALDLTKAGYVQTVHLGTHTASGTDFRKALGLRSAAFTIAYTDAQVFSITTHGYGHGVGMSQNGANAMALAGKSYRDILMHYFPGTEFGTAA